MFSSEDTGSSVRGPDGAEVRRQTSSSTVPRNLSARAMEATFCCRVGFGGDKFCCGDVDAVGVERLAMALGERFNERTRAWSQDIPQPPVTQEPRPLTLKALFASFSERWAISVGTSEDEGTTAPCRAREPASRVSPRPLPLSVATPLVFKGLT
jgi:hypothetical protein